MGSTRRVVRNGFGPFRLSRNTRQEQPEEDSKSEEKSKFLVTTRGGANTSRDTLTLLV